MSGHFSSLLTSSTVGVEGRLPVTVLTGFLGSGKTTLLNRLLKQPDLHGIAVIVNEFGEVGIDHDLISQSADETVLLANGCLCCAVRSDLVDALGRLAARSDSTLRHVLIETSGLADPGPILRTLTGEPGIRARFDVPVVVCVVDAVLAMQTLDQHPESVQQVAVADHLVVTKTDLVDGHAPSAALLARLTAINALAEVQTDAAQRGSVLRGIVDEGVAHRTTTMQGRQYRRIGAKGAGVLKDTPQHRDDIASFVLVRDEPLPRDAFAAWLDMVIAMRGADLLRVKGLVQILEQPDRPMVIHGAQHLFQPPEFLAAWPTEDRRTRIVFITRGVAPEALGDTLDILARRHMRSASKTPG